MELKERKAAGVKWRQLVSPGASARERMKDATTFFTRTRKQPNIYFAATAALMSGSNIAKPCWKSAVIVPGVAFRWTDAVVQAKNRAWMFITRPSRLLSNSQCLCLFVPHGLRRCSAYRLEEKQQCAAKRPLLIPLDLWRRRLVSGVLSSYVVVCRVCRVSCMSSTVRASASLPGHDVEMSGTALSQKQLHERLGPEKRTQTHTQTQTHTRRMARRCVCVLSAAVLAVFGPGRCFQRRVHWTH